MVDQITFRTNDNTRWGTGAGTDLTPTQVDINFWVLYTALAALQDHAENNAGISSIMVTGNQMTVLLQNHVALGPFTLPTAAFNFRGEWQADAAYNINDVFTADGALYLVIFQVQDAGAAPFFAGANDGNGHDFYAPILAAPDSELPADGNPGAFLQLTLLDSPGSVVWTNLTRNIAFYLETAPNPNEQIVRYIFTESTTFPVGLTGSRAGYGTPPTADQAYELFQNGASIGTITFTPSPDEPTFTFPVAITFQPGDVLEILAPSVPDPHMTLIAMTLVGTLP